MIFIAHFFGTAANCEVLSSFQSTQTVKIRRVALCPLCELPGAFKDLFVFQKSA
jgi:hypothetical protein